MSMAVTIPVRNDSANTIHSWTTPVTTTAQSVAATTA